VEIGEAGGKNFLARKPLVYPIFEEAPALGYLPSKITIL